MPDVDDVRRLALAQPEAQETPHFGRTSFRVRGRIFATLREGEPSVNLALPPDVAAGLLETDVSSVTPIAWGAIRGWVSLDLTAARPGLLEALIPTAWGRVAPKTLQSRPPGR